jgi:hypothetical protein
MDAPVERELEGPPVEAPIYPSVAACSGPCGRAGAQNVYSGAHDDLCVASRGGRGRRVNGMGSQYVARPCRRRVEVPVADGQSSEAARPWQL